MNAFAIVVSVLALLGSLVLVLRSSDLRGMAFERKAAMAAVWAVIFLAAVFLFGRLG